LSRRKKRGENKKTKGRVRTQHATDATRRVRGQKGKDTKRNRVTKRKGEPPKRRGGGADFNFGVEGRLVPSNHGSEKVGDITCKKKTKKQIKKQREKRSGGKEKKKNLSRGKGHPRTTPPAKKIEKGG